MKFPIAIHYIVDSIDLLRPKMNNVNNETETEYHESKHQRKAKEWWKDKKYNREWKTKQPIASHNENND